MEQEAKKPNGAGKRLEHHLLRGLHPGAGAQALRPPDAVLHRGASNRKSKNTSGGGERGKGGGLPELGSTPHPGGFSQRRLLGPLVSGVGAVGVAN